MNGSSVLRSTVRDMLAPTCTIEYSSSTIISRRTQANEKLTVLCASVREVRDMDFQKSESRK